MEAGRYHDLAAPDGTQLLWVKSTVRAGTDEDDEDDDCELLPGQLLCLLLLLLGPLLLRLPLLPRLLLLLSLLLFFPLLLLVQLPVLLPAMSDLRVLFRRAAEIYILQEKGQDCNGRCL